MASPEFDASVEYLDKWVSEQQKNNELAGLSVSVSDGAEIFTAASGHANAETEENIVPSTRFAISSQTKPATAAACLALVEDGRLALEDTAEMYVSRLAHANDKRIQDITIRSLLQHTSGLARDMSDASYWDLSAPFPESSEILDEVTERELVFDPQLKMKYSNLGYAILGLVIEEVTDAGYTDALQEIVLDRLELERTGFTKDQATATGHVNRDGVQVPLEFPDSKALAPATGLVSDVGDIHRLYSALIPDNGDNSLLRQPTKQLMGSPRVDVPNSNNLSYGLGLDYGYVGDREVIGHGGGYPGFVSFTLTDVEYKHSVAVLSNSIEADAIQIAMGAMSILAHFHQHGSPESDLLQYEGTFVNLWSKKQLVATGPNLYSIQPGTLQPFNGAEILAPRGADSFVITGANGFESDGELVQFDAQSGRVLYAGRYYENVGENE